MSVQKICGPTHQRGISIVQLNCSGQLPRVHRPVQRGGQAEWFLRRVHDESRPLRVKDVHPGNGRHVAGDNTGAPPGNKMTKCILGGVCLP